MLVLSEAVPQIACEQRVVKAIVLAQSKGAHREPWVARKKTK